MPRVNLASPTAGSRLGDARRASRAIVASRGLIWRSEPKLAAVMTAAQVFQALIPLAELWIAKLVIDRLVTALGSRHPADAAPQVLWLIAAALGLAALRLVVSEIANYGRQVLAERVTATASVQILEHIQRLDLETLEQPATRAHVLRLHEGLFYRPAALLFRLLSGVQGVVTLGTAALLLIYLFPPALPLLVLAAVPYALVQSSAAVQLYTLSIGQTPETRTAQYVAGILSGTDQAKEVRTFGLSSYLMRRYRAILSAHERTISSLARRRGLRSVATAIIPAVVYAGIFAFLAVQALHRAITVGDLALYIGLVLRSQDALQQLTTDLSGVVENSLFVDDFSAFLRIQSTTPAGSGGFPAPDVERGVTVEGVTYRYPGTGEAALQDVSLELPARKTTAIVGENGAGKTTLVKLLTGLYRPQAGRICVDGVEIREIAPEQWRQRTAVIFQDFIRYAFTLAENIGLGQVENAESRERIAAAAERAGVGRIVARLPAGYETALGRVLSEGAELSGGEWQRVALARAFMRDAPLLILDEPTAALDARAEFETFRVLRQLTRDRTVLVISHRFSTVRLADYIYVLDRGRVVEAGAHEELLQRRGRYAELFELQAAGYQ
jgi:ATP-binding cassette subfamily B protein